MRCPYCGYYLEVDDFGFLYCPTCGWEEDGFDCIDGGDYYL